ncbi:AGAP007023-PA-like protein [Anopheles sinensis]|uniref:AGAP007023-PA-like protein n=1 Tax=Anopheles sinensis TaxID=74873 RepID=A0A084W9Y6_ANOSI|nr:AGAP007023-PA-like protein [Anopheles sinensis]
MAHRILGWLTLLSCYAYDAAVATIHGILFLDSNWEKVSSTAHKNTHISALAYDEVLKKLYFSDLDHTEYLFALDYDNNATEWHKVTKLLLKSNKTNCRKHHN